MAYRVLRPFKCQGRHYIRNDTLDVEGLEDRRIHQMLAARQIIHVDAPVKRGPGRPKGAKTRNRGVTKKTGRTARQAPAPAPQPPAEPDPTTEPDADPNVAQEPAAAPQDEE